MNGFGSMLRDYLEYHKISQTEFADRLGITQKHMNEILNNKTNISLELMITISLLTDIDINLIYYVENKRKIYQKLNNEYKSEKDIKKMLDSYYIKEMDKRGWIKLKDRTSYVQDYIDLIDYLNVKDLKTLDTFLDKRFLFKKKKDANELKIYLWINHCDQMIRNIEIAKYEPQKFNNLLEELKEERLKKYNENNIGKILKKYGIILYIEDALPGTKIRGCCKVMMNTPVIYLTKYYKEKSSFYFTLYHELMHIKKDYNKLKNKVMIDNDEDGIDELALNEMIPPTIYHKIKNNMALRDRICKEYKIPLCFLYTRFAKEGIIKYNEKEYLEHIEKI